MNYNYNYNSQTTPTPRSIPTPIPTPTTTAPWKSFYHSNFTTFNPVTNAQVVPMDYDNHSQRHSYSQSYSQSSMMNSSSFHTTSTKRSYADHMEDTAMSTNNTSGDGDESGSSNSMSSDIRHLKRLRIDVGTDVDVHVNVTVDASVTLDANAYDNANVVTGNGRNNYHNAARERHLTSTINDNEIKRYTRMVTSEDRNHNSNHHHHPTTNVTTTNTTNANHTPGNDASRDYGNMNKMLGMLHMTRRTNHDRSRSMSRNNSNNDHHDDIINTNTNMNFNVNTNMNHPRQHVNNSSMSSISTASCNEWNDITPATSSSLSSSSLQQAEAARQYQRQHNNINHNNNHTHTHTNHQAQKIPSWKRQVKLQTDSNLS